MDSRQMRIVPAVLLIAAMATIPVALAGHVENGLPEVKKTVAPLYPALAASSGADASVTMTVLVKKDGSLGPTTVMDSSVAGLGFEEAARAAVTRWKFKPARSNGKRVDAYTIVQVNLVAPSTVGSGVTRSSGPNWSYVTAGSGGTFFSAGWNFHAQWQADMMSARGVNTHAIAWFLARNNLISSSLYGHAAGVPEPVGLAGSMENRPTETGQLYSRPAGGYGPTQTVSTPRASSSMNTMALRPSARTTTRTARPTSTTYRSGGSSSSRRTSPTSSTKSRSTKSRKK